MRKVLQTKTKAGGWVRTQCGMIEIWWVREGSPPGGVEGYGPEGEQPAARTMMFNNVNQKHMGCQDGTLQA